MTGVETSENKIKWIKKVRLQSIAAHSVLSPLEFIYAHNFGEYTTT